jgi:hypothetical protein
MEHSAHNVPECLVESFDNGTETKATCTHVPTDLQDQPYNSNKRRDISKIRREKPELAPWWQGREYEFFYGTQYDLMVVRSYYWFFSMGKVVISQIYII